MGGGPGLDGYPFQVFENRLGGVVARRSCNLAAGVGAPAAHVEAVDVRSVGHPPGENLLGRDVYVADVSVGEELADFNVLGGLEGPVDYGFPEVGGVGGQDVDQLLPDFRAFNVPRTFLKLGGGVQRPCGKNVVAGGVNDLS